ncbi:MAG: hypothetical protein ACOH1E_04725 [Brevundimonas sp.]
MTPLAEKLPTMTDPDLKALRLNAVRLSESGSPTKMATAAELVPLIDEEIARRAADKTTTTVKKPRAPAKKKVIPASGHQTALPDTKAA